MSCSYPASWAFKTCSRSMPVNENTVLIWDRCENMIHWNNILKDCSLSTSSTMQVRSQLWCPKAPTLTLSPTPQCSVSLPACFDHCLGTPAARGEIGLSPHLPGMWIIKLQSHYPFSQCSTRFIDKTLVITMPREKYKCLDDTHSFSNGMDFGSDTIWIYPDLKTKL